MSLNVVQKLTHDATGPRVMLELESVVDCALAH